jgi:hypothetical protein
MSLPALIGQFPSHRSEKDGPVGLGTHEPGLLEASNRLRDGHVRDTQGMGEVDRSRFPLLADKIIDEFNIVFRNLILVSVTGVYISVRGARFTRFPCDMCAHFFILLVPDTVFIALFMVRINLKLAKS